MNLAIAGVKDEKSYKLTNVVESPKHIMSIFAYLTGYKSFKFFAHKYDETVKQNYFPKCEEKSQ